MKISNILYPIRKLHGHIHEKRLYKKERYNFYKTYIRPINAQLRKNPSTVFLVLTPAHGNLGDHAIAVSEVLLLKRLGLEYIEITGRQLTMFSQYRYMNIMNGHPIFINGGGNMSTLWFAVEQKHRLIIQNNPDSPIFLMPNTIFYEDSPYGKEELKRSIQIYNSHKHLYLFAREMQSYEYMSAIYNHVTLVPDMVFALNKCTNHTTRKGCLICLRSDIEKTLSPASEKILLEQVTQLFGSDFQHTDMFLDHDIPIADRDAMLEAKYSQFRSAELVITDRLHGMIFCAITGTPCIVVNSQSPKVRGCYEWIKNLDYIKFADSTSQIADLYKTIPSRKPYI